MECEGGCMHSSRHFSLLHKFSSDPGQPSIILVAKSATSLNLTWNVSDKTDVTYTVEWQKTGCLAENKKNSGSITTNNKWKNHFYEMKGDVGMSLHEKERNKKMPTPRHKVIHNPIPTSLFCFNMLFVCLL